MAIKNKKERTLILIKPDGVERGLIGEIIGRYESVGLKIVAMKMMFATPTLARRHYPDSMAPAIGEKSARFGKGLRGEYILKHLRSFLASGLVVALILEGEDAVSKARSVTGDTNPARAAKGTIRGDLGSDDISTANGHGRAVQNLVHTSDCLTEAEREIVIWFGIKD